MPPSIQQLRRNQQRRQRDQRHRQPAQSAQPDRRHRGHEAEQGDHERGGGAGRVVERKPVEDRGDRVGLDLRARHRAAPRRRRVDVRERRGGGADDDDPAAEQLRSRAPAKHAPERHGRHRPGWAGVVDPGAAAAKLVAIDLRARGAGRDDRERGQPVDGERLTPDRAARVDAVVRAARDRVRRAQVGVPAEHVGAAVRSGLGRAEHDVSRPCDRVVEGDVLARPGRLGELDVVDDHAAPRRPAGGPRCVRAASAGRATAA